MDIQCFELTEIDDEYIKYVVILAKYEGRFVIIRHKDRTLWELPGGKREEGETVFQAARRELFEETGATAFELTPYNIYLMNGSYGMNFYAKIEVLGELPQYEIAEIKLVESLPEGLNYGEIYYKMLEHWNQLNARSVEAVIFDLDNTLINRKLAFRAYAEQFIERFVHIDQEDRREEMIEYIIEADRDGYRKKRELYEEINAKLKLKDSGTRVEDMLEHWFSEFFKCSVLMEGAIDVLNHLKARGLKLGIITNGSVHSQNAKIDEVGIRHYFDTIIVSDEAGMTKPDTRIFQLALDRLQATAGKTLFVGDHPVNDVKGATDAGLRGVWLQGFMEWNSSAEAPGHTIRRLDELHMLIDTVEMKRNS